MEVSVLFWPLLLVALGFGLLALELFIPSGGLLTVLSAVSFVGAVVMGYRNGGPTVGTVILLGLLIAVPGLLIAAVRWWPETPLGRLILIQRPAHEDDVLPKGEGYDNLKELIGQRGVAKSPLLPSGAVSLNGRTYEALSDDEAIEKGQSVKVVAIRERRIIVRLAGESAPAAPRVESEAERLSRPLDAEFEDPFGEPLA